MVLSAGARCAFLVMAALQQAATVRDSFNADRLLAEALEVEQDGRGRMSRRTSSQALAQTTKATDLQMYDLVRFYDETQNMWILAVVGQVMEDKVKVVYTEHEAGDEKTFGGDDVEKLHYVQVDPPDDRAPNHGRVYYSREPKDSSSKPEAAWKSPAPRKTTPATQTRPVAKPRREMQVHSEVGQDCKVKSSEDGDWHAAKVVLPQGQVEGDDGEIRPQAVMIEYTEGPRYEASQKMMKESEGLTTARQKKEKLEAALRHKRTLIEYPVWEGDHRNIELEEEYMEMLTPPEEDLAKRRSRSLSPQPLTSKEDETKAEWKFGTKKLCNRDEVDFVKDAPMLDTNLTSTTDAIAGLKRGTIACPAGGFGVMWSQRARVYAVVYRSDALDAATRFVDNAQSEIKAKTQEQSDYAEIDQEPAYAEVDRQPQVAEIPDDYETIGDPGDHKAYVAAYDYEATKTDELSFKEGDVIEITVQQGDGWWIGRRRGGTQLFFVPSNYLKALPEEYEDTYYTAMDRAVTSPSVQEREDLSASLRERTAFSPDRDLKSDKAVMLAHLRGAQTLDELKAAIADAESGWSENEEVTRAKEKAKSRLEDIEQGISNFISGPSPLQGDQLPAKIRGNPEKMFQEFVVKELNRAADLEDMKKKLQICEEASKRMNIQCQVNALVRQLPGLTDEANNLIRKVKEEKAKSKVRPKPPPERSVSREEMLKNLIQELAQKRRSEEESPSRGSGGVAGGVPPKAPPRPPSKPGDEDTPPQKKTRREERPSPRKTKAKNTKVVPTPTGRKSGSDPASPTQKSPQTKSKKRPTGIKKEAISPPLPDSFTRGDAGARMRGQTVLTVSGSSSSSQSSERSDDEEKRRRAQQAREMWQKFTDAQKKKEYDATYTAISSPQQAIEYEAIHDFAARNPGELSIAKGEVIEITSQQGDWLFGTVKDGASREGWVPSDYLQEMYTEMGPILEAHHKGLTVPSPVASHMGKRSSLAFA